MTQWGPITRDPPMSMTPADMEKYVVAELSSNEKLIRAAGIKSLAAPKAHKRRSPRWRCP
jgi:hypothetical protein